MADKITQAVACLQLTQSQAAALMEVDQPEIGLSRGRLSGFALDRLMRYLVLLGNDVEIVVKARRRLSRRRG